MRLDQALLARGLAPSRSRAQELIKGGHVLVDGLAVTKPSISVEDGIDLALASTAHDYVSRAALKLAHGLEHFGIDVAGKISLDLGSSTGGFTDVLLRGGALKVYAIDVGTDQLHPSLKEDLRVTSLEGTHSKDLSRSLVPEGVNLVVCDVSFISIVKALPPALMLSSDDAELVTLVKPQFELGRQAIGKNGRVLASDQEQRTYIDQTITPFLATLGWNTRGVTASPILGGAGTTEYLLHAQKTSA